LGQIKVMGIMKVRSQDGTDSATDEILKYSHDYASNYDHYYDDAFDQYVD